MPMLLRELAISGSRKADGTPNASGYVFLYQPGTTILMTGWKDQALSQAWPNVAGGIQLDAAGRAIIWVDGRVDVVVQDVTGATLETLAGYADTPAGDVTIANAGFTGAATDPTTGNVTQVAGGVTDLDTVLSSAAASFGGADFKYLESSGATGRSVQSVIRSFAVTPEDFGAVGNLVADDTIAVQAALNEAVRLGGATVLFERQYKVSQSLTLPQSNGVAVVGRSSTGTSSQIKFTNGSSLVCAKSSGLQIRDLLLLGSVAIVDPFHALLERIQITGGTTGLTSTSPSSGQNALIVRDSWIFGTTNALSLTDTVGFSITGSILQASTNAGLIIAGATGNGFVSNVAFSGLKGASWIAAASGTEFVFTNCPSLGDGSVFTPLDTAAISADPGIIQSNCLLNSVTKAAAADGVAVTQPDTNYSANVIHITSGAGTATLGLPLLTAGSAQDGKEFVIEFWNNSGSGIVWALNAIWHTAAGVSGTNGNITVIRFRYDAAGTCWREMARAVTT